MSLRSKENINLRMIMTAIRRHDLYTLVLGSYNKQWYLEGRISNRNFMTSFERTERRAVINFFFGITENKNINTDDNEKVRSYNICIKSTRVKRHNQFKEGRDTLKGDKGRSGKQNVDDSVQSQVQVDETPAHLLR